MSLASNERDPQKIVTAIQQIEQGRLNAGGTCVLAANAGSTTVAAMNCGAQSQPFLFPLTAHAAAELATGNMYVSAVSNGSFTVQHSNNAQTDRKFSFVCLG